MKKNEELFCAIGEFLCGIACLFALAVAIGTVVNAFENKANAEPIVHTTINRADFEPAVVEDSGDSELPLVKLANFADRLTGWSDMHWRKQAKCVKCGGLFMETFGKSLMGTRRPGCVFVGAVCQNAGVQMQVQAMNDLGEISHNPLIAMAQGFLIGL